MKQTRNSVTISVIRNSLRNKKNGIMWDLHLRTWKRPLSEHYLKAEYGGRKYCSKTSHLFLSSSGLLPRSHNFFEKVIADAEEEKQSALVQALASIDHLLVCLWTSARAELMTGASQGNTSIALPLFTSQNSWTDNQWAPSQISMLNLTIFFDGNHLTNATHFPWLRATIGHSVSPFYYEPKEARQIIASSHRSSFSVT